MKTKGLNVVIVLLVLNSVVLMGFGIYLEVTMVLGGIYLIPMSIFFGCFAYVVYVLKKAIEKNNKWFFNSEK